MSGYDIFLSDGDLLTTVNVKTVDEQGNSSLFLIGQGIPNYGTMIAQNFIWMLEHFSKDTPPVNPLEGQQWHDRSLNRMNFYTGNDWHHYDTPQSSMGSMFDMLGTAIDIDFTLAGSTDIFTADLSNYYTSFLFLVPNGAVTAPVMPTFNVSVATAGDIVSSMTIGTASVSKFSRIATNMMPAIVTPSSTVSINVTSAASGGRLNFDAYLFGLTTPAP